MEQEKKFRTKTGYCHILSDKIILTRDGIIGSVSQKVVGNTIYKILIIYSLMAIGFLFFAFKSYQDKQIFLSFFFTLFGVYLIYGIFKSLNNSATPIIDRKKIKRIDFKKGIKGLTRSRFEVLFENEQGKIQKRLILLLGSLSDGQNETQKAVTIMKEEGLID